MTKNAPPVLPASYLVRIYRRDPDDPAVIVGTVQALERDGATQPFQSRQQLLELLGSGACMPVLPTEKDEVC